MNHLPHKNKLLRPGAAVSMAALALTSIFTAGGAVVDAKPAQAASTHEQSNKSEKPKKKEKLTKKEKKEKKLKALESALEIPNSQDPEVLAKQTANILDYTYTAVLLYGKEVEDVAPWYEVLYSDPAQRELFKQQLASAQDDFKAPPAKYVDFGVHIISSSVDVNGMPRLELDRTLTIGYADHNGWRLQQRHAYNYSSDSVVDPRTGATVPGMRMSVDALSEQELSEVSGLIY